MTEITRLSVTTPEGEQKSIKGEVEFIPAAPKQVHQKLLQEGDPYSDYFIFKGPQNGAFLFQAKAGDFSLAGKKLSDYKVQIPQNPATLDTIIDNDGNVEIGEIQVVARRTSEGPSLPHETFLQKKLMAHLQENLQGKKPTLEEMKKIMVPAGLLLDQLAAGSKMAFEKTGNKTFRLKILFEPAPLAIHLEGLPFDIRQDAKNELHKLLTAQYRQHPLIKNRERKGHEIKEPKSSRDSRLLAWEYPEDASREPPSEATRLFGMLFGDIPVDFAPPLEAGEPIPLSQSLLAQLSQWLQKRLKREKGLFQLKLSPKDQSKGLWELRAKKNPLRIRIDPQVASLEEALNIDLETIREDTENRDSDWSIQEMEDLIEKLQTMFREKGLEWDPPLYLLGKDGTIWLQLHRLVPLVKRESIELKSDDVFPSDFPPLEKLKEILFGEQDRLTRVELLERVKKMAETIRRSDFLLASAYPDDPNSGSIPVTSAGEKNFFYIAFAKMGVLAVKGEDVQGSSLATIKNALRWEGNKPFRPKEFYKTLQRALAALNLKLDGDIQYVYTDDGRLDITITIEKPKSYYQIGVGPNPVTGSIMGQGGVTLSHKIPHTSNVSANVGLGKGAQNFSLGVATLPLTESGVHASAEVGVGQSEINHSESASAQAQTTLTVPLGKSGIASPLRLVLSGNTQYLQHGNAASGQFYAGGGGGLAYREGSVFLPKDFLNIYVGQEVNTAVGGNAIDTTTRANVTYQLPLNNNGLRAVSTLDIYHRQSIRGTLPSERAYGAPPNIDFARGSNTTSRISSSVAGFLVEQDMGVVELFAGITCSNIAELDSREIPGDHNLRCGAGAGVQVPFLGGLRFYVGIPLDDPKLITGAGISGSW